MSSDRNVADDPRRRTSLSWMRTALGFVLVALLVERGFILKESSRWGTALVLVSVGVLLLVATVRTSGLRAGTSSGFGRELAIGCAIAVTILVLVAVVMVYVDA